MAIVSSSNGHEIFYDKYSEVWRYEDNCDIHDNNNPRPCKHCKRESTEEGYDGCLGELMGVRSACCGHGNEENCYVQFLDYEVIEGRDAKIILDVLRKYRMS